MLEDKKMVENSRGSAAVRGAGPGRDRLRVVRALAAPAQVARALAGRVRAAHRPPEAGPRGIKISAPTGLGMVPVRIGGMKLRGLRTAAGVPTVIAGTGIRAPIAGARVRRRQQTGRVRAERQTGHRAA